MTRIVRAVLVAVALFVPAYLLLANFAVFEPYLVPLHLAQDPGSSSGPRRYGPYPDAEALRGLRLRGYDSVVSLLDPQLVYERGLEENERRAAAGLQMRYYNFPMRSGEPLDSPRNAAALAALTELLRNRPGARVYIHCYLGKHRSRSAQNWIEARLPTAVRAGL
jgi:hypothetical protein